ncbi:hypothetical protein FNF29_00785 [Cafeteria roenbergensis]|uniref:DNA primase n=1 Tax=Cafeteria roenbergensis TaxID=33653 RepID=A0A5A8CW36_CAFRO|nr:hypothetical protein FNF29_00785 [Cafeteria roenbergensis]|eukprot:KAA0156674.1 hypothetical protein FNF29_00785 [Cafeteria roenbergensis]
MAASSSSAARAAAADGAELHSRRRPREEGRVGSADPASAGSGKRALVDDAVTFSTDLLRVYYARFFPYRPFYRWLSYSQDPSMDLPMAQKGFMARREFSFTIENDIYIRYLSFGSEAELVKGIQSRQPHKIDIGAVFTHPPCNKESTKKGSFLPVERELIFDIDLTDYDEIRTCCSGAGICHRCWPYMTVAIRVIDRGLREDFGFKHIFWVYSGRRGVHCWVCDRSARALGNDGRSAIVEYFSAINGTMEKNAADLVPLTVPLHPSLKRALGDLETMFIENIIPESGQGLLADGQTERWESVLAFVPDVGDLKETVRVAWAAPGVTASQRWVQLQSAVAHTRSGLKQVHFRERTALAKAIPTIVLAFTYPRIDVNVTKGINHLLKSPFCVHPKTGRVCVPIVAEDCESFDPMQVPTIPRLVAEFDAFREAGGDDGAAAAAESGSAAPAELWRQTSLGDYMTKWERGFLRPLERDIAATMRRRAERAAAVTGDW